MKKRIEVCLQRLPYIMAGVLLLVGCTAEPLETVFAAGSQDRSPMTIELGVSTTDVGIRTRAATVGDDEMADVFLSSEINSLWVGVFDVQTGDLVGKNLGRFSEGAVGPKKDSAIVDILYYDAHPTIRIFGVANYEGIKARRSGESDDVVFSNLSDLLADVTNMSDLFEISVNAESANEIALSGKAPLMIGVYKEEDNDIFTVKARTDGTYVAAYGEADITLNDASVEHMYDRMDYAKLTGSIRLRRLLSQVNVKVEAGSWDIAISNLRYRKVYMPTEVYLQERQTTGMNGTFSIWKVETPNKADVLVGTNGNIPGTISALKAYESDEDFMAVEDEGMSFMFHQYENKHWGNGFDREATRKMTDFAGNPVFTALCGDNEVGTVYNNYASYFELMMDVADEKNDQRGTVIYRIHEGYCNDENGVASPKNTRDFSCFRNTTYNYTVKVNGLNSIDVSVETHNHNNGVVDGELLSKGEEFEVKGGGETLAFTGKLMDYVCYYENNGSPIIYGNNKDSKLFSIPALASVADNWVDAAGQEFGFTFGGVDVRDLFKEGSIPTIPEGEVNVLDITAGKEGHFKPKSHVHSLYLLVDVSKENDPCKNYKYYRCYYSPKDTRLFITEDADFSLAFANTWDENSYVDNGAVSGYISAIDFSKVTADIPDDAVPEYKVYVDNVLVYTSGDLEKIDLWALCNDVSELKGSFSANSVHTVNVIISDKSEDEIYQDYDSEDIKFMVYPTRFKWNYANWDGQQPTPGENQAISAGYFFAGNAHITDTDKYAGVRHVRSMSVGRNSNGPIYLQTGGSDNRYASIEITALYDAVLTVYPSATGNSWNYTRYLEVQDSEGLVEKVYAAIPSGNPAENVDTPYHFYVKKGTVTIYSGGSLNIYSVELAYLNSPEAPGDRTWNFSATPWGKMMYEAVDGQDISYYSTVVDGLHLETNGSAIQINKTNKYVDVRGGGSVASKNRVFWFDVYKPGTVKVYAGTGKAGTERNMIVQYGNTTINLPGSTDTARPSSPGEAHIDVVDQPTRVYVYSASGGMFVYEIDYVEDK